MALRKIERGSTVGIPCVYVRATSEQSLDRVEWKRIGGGAQHQDAVAIRVLRVRVSAVIEQWLYSESRAARRRNHEHGRDYDSGFRFFQQHYDALVAARPHREPNGRGSGSRNIGAVFDQHPHGSFVSDQSRFGQRHRITEQPGRFRVGIRAAIEQKLHDIGGPELAGGDQQRSAPVAGARIYVRAVLDQETRFLQIRRGPHQGRRAVVVASLRIGAPFSRSRRTAPKSEYNTAYINGVDPPGPLGVAALGSEFKIF